MSFIWDDRGLLRFEPWTRLPWLRHGFSSVSTGNFQDRSARESLELLGDEHVDLATVRQTHSATVWQVNQSLEARPERLEGDALIGDRRGVLLAVRTADCGSILIVDRRRRATAAVHAGWRGSAARIAAAVVEAMRREFGSAPEDLEAVLGPCIGPSRYEVGEEVAEQFEAEAIRRRAGAPRPFLDLAEANRRQLAAAGLAMDQIHTAALCTYEDQRFYSHRRDGSAAGRMLAVIGVTSSSADRTLE